MDTLPKYINGLSETNKMKRCAAYKQLFQLVKSDGSSLTKKDSFDVIRACLKGFEDSSERCREEAINTVHELVESQDANVLDWILPSIVTRIGVSPIVEESEEIRLRLLVLASKCMTVFPHDIGPKNYIDFFQVLLENCLADPYPDLKKEACRIAVQICRIEPIQVKSISLPLAEAVKKHCLLHKHSSVRSEASNTLATLIKHGAVEVLSEKSDGGSRSTEVKLYILCNDHSEAVRTAVLNVLNCILLDIKERLEYHRKYLPHVLVLSTDSFNSVQQKAECLLTDIGKLFLMDNEDNRVDLNSRRVTMKDIEWYGDDDYPDMNLLSVEEGKYEILKTRPSLGARYAVAEATRGFLNRVLEDITAIDWVIPFSTNNKRVMALRILWVAILHNEKSSVQFTEHILSSLYKALRDENNEVKEEAHLCVEILGKFLTPEQYLPFLMSKKDTVAEETSIVEKLGTKTVISKPAEGEENSKTPTLFSTAAVSTKCSILTVLGFFILGSKKNLTTTHATQIITALTSDDLISSDSGDLLCSLIDCFNMIFQTFADLKFFPSPSNPLPEEVRKNPQQRTLDSLVFYALLKMKASPLEEVQRKASESIQNLSEVVTGDPRAIYDLHGPRILSRYAFLLPAGAFSDVVLNTKCEEGSSQQITLVLVDKLSEVDFSLRVTEELRFFFCLGKVIEGEGSLFN